MLADVSINRLATSSSSDIDFRLPFSTTRQGGGLIEIGKHGGYPCKDQDLNPLKVAIESLVLSELETFTPSAYNTSPEEQFNVLVEKVAHDKFHYLLYLEKPIDRGQAVAAVFPSLVSTLSSRKYEGTEFRRRHIVDEAIRTLSLKDLRSLLLWLCDRVLGLTGYSENLSELTNICITFKSACECRRRLCWVSRRIQAAIGESRISSEDTKLCGMLDFGRHTREKKEWAKLPLQNKAVFSEIIMSQLLLELKWTLELDVTCGTGNRL